MIPIKLHLQNFMAYKKIEPLDLSNIHVACLVGQNGAGKSTLLDSITWALWSKARVRDNDKLIHLGENEMWVEFTFELGGETYRILRRRSSKGRGRSELAFDVARPTGWTVLTENSIRLTQAKIDRLLRLDYDTFINSAFLLQGRADEFTNKRPSERKKILSDVLGLGIYDEYAERAKEKTKKYGQDIKFVAGKIEQMDREIAREPEFISKLIDSRQLVASLSTALKKEDERLNALREQYQTLKIKQGQLDGLRKRIGQIETDIDNLAKSVNQTEAKIQQYQSVIEKSDVIEIGYQAWILAQKEVQNHDERFEKFSVLSQKRIDLASQLKLKRQKIEHDINTIKPKIETMSAKITNLDSLQKQLTELTGKLADLSDMEREREENRKQLNKFDSDTTGLRTENKQLRGEMDKVKQRLRQLEDVGSECPLCTQSLDDTHRLQVQLKLTEMGTTMGNKYRANRKQLSTIELDYRAINEKVKQANKKLKQQSQLQREHARVEQVIKDTQQFESELPELQSKLKRYQAMLVDNKFAPEIAAELVQVESKLADMAYNKQVHQSAKKQVRSQAHFADEWQQLKTVRALIPDEKERLDADIKRQSKLIEQIAEDHAIIKQLVADTKVLVQVEKKLKKCDQGIVDIQKRLRDAKGTESYAEQMLDHISAIIKEKREKKHEFSELKEIQNIYKELQAAFGKKGVQALLIETVIPELQDEANNILGRMTDGRMHLQFITQKETKTTSSMRETLDIRIADEIGTRDYEAYSGGEQFRINFALRLALSKLLSRRAGAKLQTLVIDEGFGTQDAQGRERLIESINKIQDDFEKIIVITHIDELKEAFQTHIAVEKTAQGSTISVH